VPGLLQRARHGRKAHRDQRRDLRGAVDRIERERLNPNQAQALADLRVAQPGERDPEALGIRELAVVLAGHAEVGIELETVADVDDHEESGHSGSALA
jgi:hypothetical protein